jgi:hypothetical protein
MNRSFVTLRWRHLHLWMAMLMSLVLTACGGGADSLASGGVGEGGTGASLQAASIGVITGIDGHSIPVNGVTFDRSAAIIADDMADAGVLSDKDLKPGMWVQVEGVTDANGNAPEAKSIQVIPAVRGEISSVDSNQTTITVLDNKVQVDTNTTLVEGTGGAALAVGDTVEVHGLLGASAGTVVASRIDKLAAMPVRDYPYELRGKVTKLDATAKTMKVGGQLVSYANANLVLPKALSNGMVLRVSADLAPTAGQAWAIKRLLPDQAPVSNLSFLYVEGIVDQWTTGPSFLIESLPVNAATANGKLTVTQDGQRVAAIGALRDGVLVAKSVAVVVSGTSPTFVLAGPVAAYQSLADFKVRAVSVDASGATFSAGDASQVINDIKVKVEGQIVGRKLVATKIKIVTP